MMVNGSSTVRRKRKRDEEDDAGDSKRDSPDNRLTLLSEFQKVTQIYENLKIRSALCPLFLPRTLRYLRHRMSRSNKSRNDFKVDEMLDKEQLKIKLEPPSPVTYAAAEFLKLCISGYVDPFDNAQDFVAVQVIVKKNLHKKRNDIKTISEEIEVCNVKVPRNPGDKVTTLQPATALIPTSILKFDVTVKSYTLKFIIKCNTSEAKLWSEVPLCDPNTCSLEAGDYTFLLHKMQQETGHFNMEKENHVEALDKGPNLKAQIFWSSTKNKKTIKPKIEKKETETLMEKQVNTNKEEHNTDIPSGLKVEFVFVKNKRVCWPCQVETKYPLVCPWCKINCGNLCSFFMHLNLCHPRLSFIYKPKSENNIRIDVKVNTFYDGSYVGNHRDLISQRPTLGFGRGARRCSVFTEVIVERPKHKILNLTDFSEPMESRETFIRGHQRVYFDSETNLPLSLPKNEGGSLCYDEPPEWMYKYGDLEVDEFADVNEGEKVIFKMWNHHILQYNLIADFQMKDVCFSFVENNGSEIIKKRLYYNFVLHLTCLHDFTLLSAQDMYSVLQSLQQVAAKIELEERKKLARPKPEKNVVLGKERKSQRLPIKRSVKINVKPVEESNVETASTCDKEVQANPMPPLKRMKLEIPKLNMKPHEVVIIKTASPAQVQKRSKSADDSITPQGLWHSNFMKWLGDDKKGDTKLVTPRARRQTHKNST